MMWKVIGQSVIGTSHIQSGKSCEDAICYNIVQTAEGSEVLVCCVSDGAGTAKYAAKASSFITTAAVNALSIWVSDGKDIGDADILQLCEQLYDAFVAKAQEKGEELNEFSCTLLGCVIYSSQAVFFQIGDGALIRDDGSNSYVHIWWPQNGEYSNTTNFFIDDAAFANVKSLVITGQVNEVGIFTDGLQLLALNNENLTVHQPFFTGMFKWLRKAKTTEDVGILNKKLGEYLAGDLINSRTDDDKTLLLATRLSDG